MNTNNVLVHDVALVKNSAEYSDLKAIFYEGTSVFVKIIRKNSDTSYRVSVLGSLLDIHSKIPLNEGTSFYAKVIFDGKKMLLQKMSENKKNEFFKFNKNSAFGENSSISNLLNTMGLVPDEISVVLLQQMRRLGLAFSPNLMKKVRTIAEKLKKSENAKDVSQIAYILESKGILSNLQTVLPFLQEQNNSSKEDENKSDELNSDFSACFNSFFKSLFDSTNKTAFLNKTGLLTLFNHLGFNFNSFEQRGNWIKIPFDFQYKVSQKVDNDSENEPVLKKGFGTICCFLDGKTGKCSQSCVRFNFSNTSIAALLVFSLNELSEIKIFVPQNQKNFSNFLEFLQEKFPSVKISHLPFEDFFQFYVEDDNLTAFRGVV